MISHRLFHVSEDPNIKIFIPRPSPSDFDSVKTDVVFAVSDKLLHNYLLPRDCPRVAFYKSAQSSLNDIETYFGQTKAEFVMAVESGWLEKIRETKIYCYEFPTDTFTFLDECAGYYTSCVEVKPISIKPIDNILGELAGRNVELRILPELRILAEGIQKSSLNFSLIRMRNAISPKK